MIEVFRDAKDAPYRVKKPLGGIHGIHVGEIFVRHGSHTEQPSETERLDLEEEGNLARGGNR